MRKFNLAQAINSANEALIQGNIPWIDPENYEVYRQDNFTVVRLTTLCDDTLGGYVGYGVSKRNPGDKSNQAMGTKLAFSRAVKNYIRAVRADQKRERTINTKIEIPVSAVLGRLLPPESPLPRSMQLDRQIAGSNFTFGAS